MPLLLAPALFLAPYALLSGLTWTRRLVGKRPARRKGMILNLIRRAGPPMLAGFVAFGTAALTSRPGAYTIGVLLLAGGLAYAFHKGLAELGQSNWQSLAPRLAISLAGTLFLLWQFQLI